MARHSFHAGNRPGAMPAHKYRPFAPVPLPDRRWPEQVLARAPRWCSVDLRDGNQALVEPMGGERKRRLFTALVETGFAEIEVGFPSASQTDHGFLRELIEARLVPDDVTLQVLTQARADLIEATFAALRGARRAIVHLYNSTSELQRRVVFRSDRRGIVDLAVRGAVQVREQALRAERDGTEVIFQYSPESFTGTELEFALEICEAVMDVFEPSVEQPMIVNLPATVEMATPNVYADQIEWFARHVRDRDRLVLSVHPHNDRGCAVAAAELGLMAGADRVEGTLFGNGERTGNVDLVTLALNLATQGVDPALALSDLPGLVALAEQCNRLPVHPRHPYAGELVFTAFSGSHQDAIRKGLEAQATRRADGDPHWEVPYLPIDPGDVGRQYEPVIRINSQSGKGGVAFVIEQELGFRLPRKLQLEFSGVIQAHTDERECEAQGATIARAFEREYVLVDRPFAYVAHRFVTVSKAVPGVAPEAVALEVRLRDGCGTRTVRGSGRGPIDAFVDALRRECGIDVRVVDFREHSLEHGEDARAAAYVELACGGGTFFGVGVCADIVGASLQSVIVAVDRMLAAKRAAEGRRLGDKAINS